MSSRLCLSSSVRDETGCLETWSLYLFTVHWGPSRHLSLNLIDEITSLLVWVCLANTWWLQESWNAEVGDVCSLTPQYLPVFLEHYVPVLVNFLCAVTRRHLADATWKRRDLHWLGVWMIESNMARKAQQRLSVCRSSCLSHGVLLEADCSAKVEATYKH